MIKNFCYRILCGFFLGLSILAPGISSSIVAISMGIYQDLIRIASNPFKNTKENIQFCIPLAIGAALSTICFVIIFSFLFTTYEKATFLLFAGLIAGSIPIITKEIKKYKLTKRHLVSGILAFTLILTFFIFGNTATTNSDVVTASLLFLSISGLVAGSTFLIPGMSTSTVLSSFAA